MFRKLFFVFLMASSAGLLLSAAPATTESKGIVNGPNKRWEVKYHKDEKNANSSNAVAIRLKIEPDGTSTTQLIGTLTLWRGTTMSGATTIYDPATKVEFTGMTGQIDTNPGDNDNRKLQRFHLSKEYMDGTTMKIVTVKGFHYTGRSKGKGNRGDDQLVVRIKDRLMNLLVPTGTTDCDAAPPDEDVLTEETIPDTNPPDPDYNAP